MADLSEVALPTRFVLLALGPEDDGPNAIWELSEMGRSLGSMLGDKVIFTPPHFRIDTLPCKALYRCVLV